MAVKKKKAKSKTTILPKKMSALIGIALKDLKKAEATKDMVIDMSEWYVGDAEMVCTVGGTVVSERQVCSVCFAGSVIAGTLKKKGSTQYILPVNCPGNQDQLLALNHLRSGEVRDAAYTLGLIGSQFDTESEDGYKMYDIECDAHIPDYDNMDPKPFHRAMEKLQKALAKAGF